MIEKFSKEEINQILRELGLSQKTIVPKKSIALAEQKARIAKVFKNEFYPNTRETKQNGVPIAISKRNVQKNVFDSIVAIVDYTLGNFEILRNLSKLRCLSIICLTSSVNSIRTFFVYRIS